MVGKASSKSWPTCHRFRQIPLPLRSHDVHPASTCTQTLYTQLLLEMELALRFLSFLRKLVSVFRKRWGQSTRRLWYIFAFVRSHISPQSPKERKETRRNVEHRPAMPPTTVVCASRLPPPLTSIPGDDNPIALSTPTIPSDTVYDTHVNRGGEQSGTDDYFPEESRPISRSPDPAGHHDDPEPVHVVLPRHQVRRTSNPLVTLSRPTSQCSHRPASQDSVHRPPSQCSSRKPSQHSYRSPLDLNGVEAVARGYLNAPPSSTSSSPAPPVHPPSVTGSIGSPVNRASRPTTRVPGPSSIRNASQRRARSSTPASARQSVHSVPSELPQPAPSKGRLHPMIGVSRYEKHRAVVIGGGINTHISPPVTTQFVRWVFAFS